MRIGSARAVEPGRFITPLPLRSKINCRFIACQFPLSQLAASCSSRIIKMSHLNYVFNVTIAESEIGSFEQNVQGRNVIYIYNIILKVQVHVQYTSDTYQTIRL